jgi:anti-sigma-K factor RskA
MIDEVLQDEAALHLLRMLPLDEASAFEKRMDHDEEVRALLAKLERAAGHLALVAPPAAPPGELKSRILAEIRHEVRLAPRSISQRFAWVPWTLAAALAIATGLFWREAQALREVNREQHLSLIELQSRDEFSNLKLVALSAKVADYEKALAAVVFDSEHQRGLVELARFPQPDSGKAYQLWILPAEGKPVSGGVVPVDHEGVARISFTPSSDVRQVNAFAISVEPSGGSEQLRGEVVLGSR